MRLTGRETGKYSLHYTAQRNEKRDLAHPIIVLSMDGSWTVFRGIGVFFGRVEQMKNPSNMLKSLKKYGSGEYLDRPVTPEVASSSLVGPAWKIKGLCDLRNPLIFCWCQIGARSAL